MYNRRSAVTGEQAACDYITKLGYKILERNYVCRAGELDIVALDGEVIVVIEVKSRDSLRFGTPAESVTPDKVRRLLLAVKQLTSEKKLYGRDFRFDLICITRGKLEHIKDAFWSN